MTSLSDSIPDVETLLELQPEELAGAILLDLATNRRGRVNRKSSKETSTKIISAIRIFKGIKRYTGIQRE